MTSPLPYHGRLSRDSPMLKSPSTPLDVYRLQHPARQASGRSSVGNGTQTSQSVFLDHGSPNTFASYRRNAGFGSPGASVARSSPRVSHVAQQSPAARLDVPRSSSTPKSARFVRRKPWQQRLREAPSIWLDRILFSEYLDAGNPALGYPLGLLLHFVSLLILAMHPSGALRFGRAGGGLGRGGARGASLFAEQGSLALRRRQQQDAAWRWSANLLFSIVLCAVIANAYHLYTARRRYHLWLKSTDETLLSENAKLVDLPSDVGAAHKKPWHDVAVDVAQEAGRKTLQATVWAVKKVLYRLRMVRYIGAVVRFFFPPSSGRIGQRRVSGKTGPQMHALDVWQAPEVPLRIFTLYSPLHLFVYGANLRSDGGLYGLTISLLLMAAVSAQTALLVHFYAGLVKDKGLIAGEVLNEYNQKFVMPRAMPVCRDASTMTMQAEMVGPDDYRPMRQHAGTQAGTEREAQASAQKQRRPKKGRVTAV